MAMPLAERMRPKSLDDYVGQQHLVGKDGVIRRMLETGRINSFILWGPPGVGKTTLAGIIANTINVPFYTISAVTSGVKDVRDIIENAQKNTFSITILLYCLLMKFIVSISRSKTLCFLQ